MSAARVLLCPGVLQDGQQPGHNRAVVWRGERPRCGWPGLVVGLTAGRVGQDFVGFVDLPELARGVRPGVGVGVMLAGQPRARDTRERKGHVGAEEHRAHEILPFRSARSSGSPFPGLRGIEALATSVPLFLLLFASSYVVMAGLSAGDSGERLTHTDGLYFAVTVFSTVGFGDITAKSQAAR